MNVWFTSDLHIGHKKIQEIRGADHAALGRGWPEDHDDYLAWSWDQFVEKDDVVWVLGDISSGTKSAQLDALEWIKARKGKKHLVIGNHDGPHPLHRDSYKWFPAYMEAFESVQMAARRRIPLEEGHLQVFMSHFPYAGDHTEEERYSEWRLKDCGHILLHGHTHSRERVSLSGRQIHVGVDAWGFRPAHLDEISELAKDYHGWRTALKIEWRDPAVPTLRTRTDAMFRALGNALKT